MEEAMQLVDIISIAIISAIMGMASYVTYLAL